MWYGGFGSNRKLDGVVGWLVCLLYLPRSRLTEKRELKGVYILLKPSENVQQACDIGLTSQEGLVYMSTANKTEQNPQKIRYGAMRKVMIGFVFPIGK